MSGSPYSPARGPVRAVPVMQSSKTSTTRKLCSGISSKPAIKTVQPGVMVRSVFLGPPQQKVRQQQAQGETEWNREGEGLQDARQASKHDNSPCQGLRNAERHLPACLELPLQDKQKSTPCKSKGCEGRKHGRNCLRISRTDGAIDTHHFASDIALGQGDVVEIETAFGGSRQAP